jgi:hypothetical protein
VFLPLFTGFVYLFIYEKIINMAKSADDLGNTYIKKMKIYLSVFICFVFIPPLKPCPPPPPRGAGAATHIHNQEEIPSVAGGPPPRVNRNRIFAYHLSTLY